MESLIKAVPCGSIIGFVIYDLPGRDCTSGASGGELEVGQLDIYKSEFIDGTHLHQQYPRVCTRAKLAVRKPVNPLVYIPYISGSAEFLTASVARVGICGGTTLLDVLSSSQIPTQIPTDLGNI